MSKLKPLRFFQKNTFLATFLVIALTTISIIIISAYSNAASSPKTAALKNPQVIMKTNFGDIRLELFPKKAPETVKNFLHYVDEKFYDGTIFHRVIGTFMIQGGGYTAKMTEKPTKPPIKNEATNKLSNKRGTIAMARTNVINSATSQFFINVVDNPFLDYQNNTARGYGYCVFGKVVSGMAVVDKIKAVPTKNFAYFQDVPAKEVTIISVRRTK